MPSNDPLIIKKENNRLILNQYLPSKTYSNNLPMSIRLVQQQNQLLLNTEEGIDDKLLLPRSTRSLKRRTSLFEKSRDWARRLITLRRPRRNTTSSETIRDVCYGLNKKQDSSTKDLDEDGYLSPLEIKAKLDNLVQENNHHHHHQSLSKLSANPEKSFLNSYSTSNVSQPVYPIPTCQCTCQQKRLPKTSFASEFYKSLSIVDYIDFDVSDELTSSKSDDPLESLKYLFTEQQEQQQGNSTRRILRRSTNTSSISTDSGYSDLPISSSKSIPVHLISCTLIPVNISTSNSVNIRCMTCTCLSDHQRRKSLSHSSRSQLRRQPVTHIDRIENGIPNHCACSNKYYSTMTICPSSIATKSITKIDDNRGGEDYYYKQQQKRFLKKKRASLMRLPSVTDDLTSISQWYKPYLEREAVCDALQQADYGAFILRHSTTHSDCYALSLKVPKFTHDSNIVHYLIEKILHNDNITYRIKGTIKQFPTLLSLLTHHSVMPEILPITLNLNESFTV